MVPLFFEDEPVKKWQYAPNSQANMFLKKLYTCQKCKSNISELGKYCSKIFAVTRELLE